jgi:rare lipoprotein A
MRLFAVFTMLFCTYALSAQQVQEGLASMIDDSFQGKETRYGVKYDKRENTCSHTLYPYGSILRVTRLDNKRAVTVRVIDEGPFVKGRIIEISRQAAAILGMTELKEAMVRVELVRRPQPVSEKPMEKKTPAPVKPSPPAPATPDKPAAPKPAPASAPAPVLTERGSPPPLVRSNYTQLGLYQVQLRKPSAAGWGIQVSVSSKPEFMLQEIASLQARNLENILISIEKTTEGLTVYKYILGPFTSEELARKNLEVIRKKHQMNGFIVNLSKQQK